MPRKKAEETIIEERTEAPPPAEVETPQVEPRGVLWSKLVQPQATAESIEAALWDADVLTVDDLNTKPNAVIGAIIKAYGVDLAALRRAAKEMKHNG